MYKSAWPLHKVGRFVYCSKYERLTLARYFGEGSRQYPHYSNSYAMGLCTGSFAAAAISTCQTISELLPAAVEAVLVAFRTGLRSFEARNDIEPRSVASPVWSAIVGIQEEQAASILDAFSKEKVNTFTQLLRLPLTLAGSFEELKTLCERRYIDKCNDQRSIDGSPTAITVGAFLSFETHQACDPCSVPRSSRLWAI